MIGYDVFENILQTNDKKIHGNISIFNRNRQKLLASFYIKAWHLIKLAKISNADE